MPLSDNLKSLHLDASLIARERTMAVGLAQGYERAAMEPGRDEDLWRLHKLSAATEYRRAAAHSVLLSNIPMSSNLFRQAGRVYLELKRPYASMMFWCAQDQDELLRADRALGVAEGLDRSQLAYTILTTATENERSDRERRYGLRGRIAGAETSPVGILGVPIGAYLDLADVLELPRINLDAVTAALLPFLASYSECVRRCMEDEYHWKLLAFPFHPAEPDILSVMLLVETTLRQRSAGSLLDRLRVVPIFPAAATLLYNAVLEQTTADGL